MNTFFLETARLRLRCFEYSDSHFLIALNADPLVIQYTGDGPIGDEVAAREIVTNLRQQFHDKKMGRFLVTNKFSHEPLGWCGLKWHEKENVVDLGYRFLRKYWGQGFATESSEICLAYGFRDLNLSQIVAHAHADNTGSIHVLRKLGFTDTGSGDCQGIEALRFSIMRDMEIYGS